MSLPPSFFEHFEDRLNLAVTDINMGISEIRERVGRALSMTYQDGGKTEVWHDGERDIELPAMVSDDEVVSALTANLQKIDSLTKQAEDAKQDMSVSGLQQGILQSILADIKAKAQAKQAEGVAKIKARHDQGLAKVEAAMDDVAKKIDKEIDDQLHEFAQSTNGGPI